jgi:hypothetical protein
MRQTRRRTVLRPRSPRRLVFKEAVTISDPTFSSFEQFSDFHSGIRDLCVDGTAISSFANAPRLPGLCRFSCHGCPVAPCPHLLANVAIAFDSMCITLVNGSGVIPSDLRRAASLVDTLRPHVLAGFLLLSFSPLRLRHAASKHRIALYQSSSQKAKPLPSTARPLPLNPMAEAPGTGAFGMTKADLERGFEQATKEHFGVSKKRAAPEEQTEMEIVLWDDDPHHENLRTFRSVSAV